MNNNDYYIPVDDDSGKLELPSDRDYKKSKSKPKLSNSEKKKIKFWIIISLIILIYLFYEPALNKIQEILKLNPTIYKIYLGVESQIINNTILGIFYVSIFGSLFFLTLPSEALFVYFLSSTQHFFFLLIILMVFGNLVGLIFNYSIGRLLGERFASKLFSKSFNKYQKLINKYGGWILLLGNIFPGPVELLTIFYGSFKYNFKQYVYLCFIGRLTKYTLLFIIYLFFWDQITFFYDDIINSGLNFWSKLF